MPFVSYYNYRRCHKDLGNVTPSDVLMGERETILLSIREVQVQPIQWLRPYDRALKELTGPPSEP